jgi:steroid delta-isomerase-like uncharacterized protein
MTMFRNLRMMLLMLMIGLLAIGLSALRAQEATPEPDLKANKALVEQFVAALNARDLAALDKLLSKDFLEFNPFVPNPPPPGPDTFKNAAGGIIAAFPDAKIKIELIMAEGDLVTTRHSITATHKGTFNGVPATNKAVTWTENHIFRIKDGQIVEHWAELNAIGLLIQIGALPAPGGQ